jgi:hypothetical protein
MKPAISVNTDGLASELLEVAVFVNGLQQRQQAYGQVS